MADNKLSDTDFHSLLIIPPTTSYNSERLYNDRDDRKRMPQLQNEIEERENKSRQEILDLEQVRQKIQEQKKKLQNEIDKNTFIDLVDDANVMSDKEKKAPEDEPTSGQSYSVSFDSDDDKDEDDDAADNNDPTGEDSDDDFQAYTLSSVPDESNTENTRMRMMSMNTPLYNGNTLIIDPIKSSIFRKYVLKQDNMTAITSKELQKKFPQTSMQTKVDTLRLIGIKRKHPTL